MRASQRRLSTDAIRLLLSAIFLLTGVAKLSHLEQFREALTAFQLLPPWGVNLTVAALPLVEIMIGGWLLVNRATRWAAYTAASLLLIFLGVVTLTLRRDLSPSCGCLPGIAERTVGWWLVLQDGILLACALYLARQKSSPPKEDAAQREAAGARSLTVAPAEQALPQPAWRRPLLSMALVLMLIGGGLIVIRQMVAQARDERANEGPRLGEAMPKMTWSSLDSGNPVDEQDLTAEDALLVFLRTDCQHCRASLPEVEKLYREVRPKGFRIMLVSESDPAQTTALVRDLNLSAPVLLDRDESMRKQFRLQHTPAFLWYRGGLLHYKAMGSQSVVELRERIRDSLPAAESDESLRSRPRLN